MLPTTEVHSPRKESDTKEPSGSVTSLLTGALMLVVGLAIGWLAFGGADEPAIETAAPSAAVPAEVGPIVEASGEPVAEVAESLLPSVVQIETGLGVGSGVIYDADGLILTAAHVVEGADQVTIRLSDGTQYEGQVLGGDVPSDIAVVEVDATDLPAAPLGIDDEVRVGQLAVAIGSPYGLDSTVTSGVISAVNQTVGRGANFQSLIQTDAAINPGNSGGALANRQGEVIGINVSIFSRSGGNDGVGFAVPIGVAQDLAESIVAGEPIDTAVLGITGSNSDGDVSGALVASVQPGSGADQAGIEVGDVVLSVDGVRVDGIGDVAAQVRANRPGDTITIELIRNGETIELEATLGGS